MDPLMLESRTTETVTFPPEIHLLHPTTTASTTTITSWSVAPALVETQPNMDSSEENEEDATQGTLERLVKPEEPCYEIPSEDKDVDDGQQPLGIVESCFPYLARRHTGGTRSAASHPQSKTSTPFAFGFCPGVRCYFSNSDYDEDRVYTKGDGAVTSNDSVLRETHATTKGAEEVPVKIVS